MDVYTTETEQLEIIKKWWQKYGNAIISVFFIVALSVFGYSKYKEVQEKTMQLASAAYDKVIQAEGKGDVKAIRVHEKFIIKEYPGTIYAHMSRLMIAADAVGEGDYKKALYLYEQVINDINDDELKQLLTVRASRIALGGGLYDKALELLNIQYSADFNVLVYEQKGDIYEAKGKLQKAREFYRLALEADTGENSSLSQIIRMKLSDIENS